MGQDKFTCPTSPSPRLRARHFRFEYPDAIRGAINLNGKEIDFMAIDKCPPDKIYGINVEKIRVIDQLERAMSLNNFEPYKGQLIEPPRPLGDIFGITHNKKEENNKVTEPKPYTKKEKALLDAFFAAEKRNERAGKAYQEACREKDEAQKALNDARIRAVNGLRFPEEDVKLIRISKNKVAIISYNNVVVREVFEQPKED